MTVSILQRNLGVAALTAFVAMSLGWGGCGGGGACAAGGGTTGSGDIVLTDPGHGGSSSQATETEHGDDTTQVGGTVTDAERTRTARAQNALGARLLQQLGHSDRDTAVAPASLYAALGMTYAGARGATAEGMARVLGTEPNDASLHAVLGETMRTWNGAGSSNARPYTLRVANRLYADRTLALLPAYVSLTTNRYGASPEQLDFHGASEASRSAINQWVESQTERRIHDLLPQGSINADTRAVLVNAIYFHGAWMQPFDARATSPRVFHAARRDVRVPFMNREGRMRTGGVHGARIVELPYAGDDLAMVVVLPDSGTTLAAFEQGLDAARFDEIAQSLSWESNQLALPKFRIESGSLALRPALSALGMAQAFTNDADFSGMSSSESMKIADVFHSVFVDVNEEGTEAAGATGVVMVPTSAPAIPAQPIVVDRPFLFYVRDVHTGAVLFLGHVTEPHAAS